MLNRSEVACQYTDEVSELVLKCIELEENIKRKNLSWQEECLSVHELYDIQSSLFEPTEDKKSWSREDTADILGYSHDYVDERLGIIEEAKKENSDIMKSQDFSTAKNFVRKKFERSIAFQVLTEFGKVEQQSVINANFHEWAATYSGPKFNFLHCDFPYGINTDKRQQGNAVLMHGGYDDSKDIYWNLLRVLCDNLNKLCTDSAHIMFWFSMHYYADTLKFFAQHSDFKIDPFPLMWLKSDNSGIINDPDRGPRRIYETCLFGSRGDRKIVQSVSNAIAKLTDRSDHMSIKPEPVLDHFFRMFVDESTAMLDPTCGSGTALRAAEARRAARVVGIDINKDFVDRATIALEKSRQRAAPAAE
jgi:hypothetical protein